MIAKKALYPAPGIVVTPGTFPVELIPALEAVDIELAHIVADIPEILGEFAVRHYAT
jgi:hypothetical protein